MKTVGLAILLVGLLAPNLAGAERSAGLTSLFAADRDLSRERRGAYGRSIIQNARLWPDLSTGGNGSVTTSCYPFKFTFKNKALLAAMQKLGNFDKDHVNIVGDQPTWFLNRVKLLIFVPVNDCIYATKISPKLRKTFDFASHADPGKLLLYLRPLPYELEFHQRKDDTVFIYIN